MGLFLGIETSCDETAVAVLQVETDGSSRILSEKISSQVTLHALYGGVVPELAAREHQINLPVLLELVLTESGIELSKLDAICVTVGPGLKGCLLIGCEFAKGLALALGLPLLGVNHIEGHIQSAALLGKSLPPSSLALVVSGGHTELIKVREFGKYELIARTGDDAAGEAFDKSAHLLGFEYPGGAALAALADSVTASRFQLPKVMRQTPGFSFSGLKTAVALQAQKADLKDEAVRAELAFAIQSSIVDALVYKLEQALSQDTFSALSVSGGVACNQSLRSRLESVAGLPVLFPEKKHCVDNAAMIAYVGGMRFQRGERHALSQSVVSRWPVEQL